MPTLTLYFDPTFGDPSWAGSYFLIEAPESLDSHHTHLGEWIIGRHPQCDITLGIPSVSRKHAAIGYSFAADCWTITDLESASGTRVDGQKLEAHDPKPIHIGSRLDLGAAKILVVEDEQDTISPDDDGPPTVVGLHPLDHRTGEPPPPPPPPPKTYADALDTGLAWLINPRSRMGALVRLLVLVLAAAVIVLVMGGAL